MKLTKRIPLGHNLWKDVPMAFDARPSGRDRDDREDDDWAERNVSPDAGPDDEREFEQFLGSVLSDALRAWKARGNDGANRELGQSDRRRGRDADPSEEHLRDFDPLNVRERARDRRRATADSRIGFDSARVRAAIKRADVTAELDELFGLRGRA